MELAASRDVGHSPVNANPHKPWEQATDDDLIGRLILAIQQATIATVNDVDSKGFVAMPAPELATALLNVPASVLGPAPQCDAPAGMRRVSEAAGEDLLLLMRQYRQQTLISSGTVN